ncbi:hypothetical protein J2X87_005643 [Pseudomonas synxantha]|uniref:Uncharacterized protein n=1 Tax=Pseudomonas synxantha TaxID=47883 RepID=A0ACC6JW00_9PSED|nr:hypothetical protein [Pseudomonas synxantha]
MQRAVYASEFCNIPHQRFIACSGMTGRALPLSATAADVHSALACCWLLLHVCQGPVPEAEQEVTGLDVRSAVAHYAQSAGVNLRLERLSAQRASEIAELLLHRWAPV